MTDKKDKEGRENAAPATAEDEFRELADYRMPFGKYKGRRLVDLPEPYVVWFRQQGFPPGKLGRLLAIVYEIKANGLEYLFNPYVRKEKPPL